MFIRFEMQKWIVSRYNPAGLGRSASKGMKVGAGMSRISMKLNPLIDLYVTLKNAKGLS